VLARQNVASVPWIESGGERQRERERERENHSGSVLISAVTGRKKSVKSHVLLEGDGGKQWQ
jgi:hypothetical protein